MVPAMSIHAWLRWDVASRLLPAAPATVLEIGCGLGALGSILAEQYEYVGVEPDKDAYEIASGRVNGGGRVLNVTIEDAPAGRFDLVCAFEVLEHIEDDAAAVGRWRERVAEGGRLLVSVPANPERFGPCDVKAGHYRRYTPETLRGLLVDAGLSDVAVGAYGFPFGYALEWGRNLYASRKPGRGDLADRTAASGRWLQPPDWMAAATWLAALPARLSQRPFTHRGTGLVAVGRTG